jgi:hypothetical protein
MNLLLYIVMASCSHIQPIDRVEWLLGKWELQTSKGPVFENWQQKGDNEFSGKSYLIKSVDTTVLETIQILYRNDSLFYIPTVNDQNEGRAVEFYSDIVNDTLLQFQNPNHDFPQTIAYHKVREDSIVASISGNRNKEYIQRIFPMKKVKGL